MHEIQKILPNGGEKFASFTNGITGDDTNGDDISAYVNKLKEANGHTPLKSWRLPPSEQSTRSFKNKIERKTQKERTFNTEKYKRLLEHYRHPNSSENIIEKYNISTKGEKEEEEEAAAAEANNYPLIDVYDTPQEEEEAATKQKLSSNIDQLQDFTILVDGDSELNDEIELSQTSKENFTIFIKKNEPSNQLLNSTAFKSVNEEQVKVQPRLLNGNVLNTSKESPNARLARKYSNYLSKKDTKKSLKKKYRHFPKDSSESSSTSDEDSDTQFNDKSLKKLVKSLTKNSNKKKRRKSQMGLNILSKLREFFNFKKPDNQEENHRKRRISEQSSGSEYTPHIKYRRVENNFPKYIESTMDNDNDLIFTHNSQHVASNFNNMMTEQNKPKLRKSMFAVPKTTRKLIRNSSFVNVELPNDEELSPLELKLPENIVTSQSSSSRLTYAQVLRQNILNQNNINRENSKMCGHGYVLGTRTSSNFPTNVTSTSTAFPLKSAMLPINPLLTQRRSMLQEQKQREDHNNYKKLLQRVQNAGFGNENSSPVMRTTRSSNLFDTVSSRRSLSINGAISKPRLSTQSYRNKRIETINNIDLTDDDDDDVEFSAVLASSSMNPIKSKKVPIIDLENERDEDVVEVIDLEDDQQSKRNALNKSKTFKLPLVDQVNTLFERIHSTPAISDNWILETKSKYSEQKKLRAEQLAEYEKLTNKLAEERREAELEIQQRLRSFQIIDPDCLIVDEFPESDLEDDTEPRLIPLTEEHHDVIKRALQGPPDQVLVNKFNLSITRRDIHTLQGLNWLNDEVINFYMNLLTERSEKKKGLPAVYAMNTFFVQRLLQNGHGGVKRWTRKVDIFSKELIPVPVHVGGVHWCMAIINLKEKSIKYYDSMGSPNPTVLRALAQYLRDESMDKRKQPYDTSKFHIESVQDVPRQMNGSDCGVFSCMFAEFVTRNRNITFSQQHMEYFRYKMIVEIVQGELLH